MTTQRPAAVLWDMDGTIVDTEPLWIEAQRELLAAFDLAPLTDEEEESLVGASMRATAELFVGRGVRLTPEEVVTRVTGDVSRRMASGFTWRPGALELLAALRDAGIAQGLVTNSPATMAEHLIAALPAGTFAAVVTADDVTRSKPHPQPYALAARHLDAAPRRCVVVEDSTHGLASGRAAGMVTIGVPHGARLVEGDADVLLPTLVGITIDDLARHLASHAGIAA